MKKRQRTFRHKIEIEHKTMIKGDYGQPIEAWATFATVRAEVDPLSGREYWASRQVQAELSYRVSFRHIKGIEPTMRMKWGERILEIQAALNPMGQNYEIQLICKEQVS